MNIAGAFAEVGGNFPLDLFAVHRVPLVIHFFHHPDVTGNGDLFPSRRGLYNGAQFLRVPADSVFLVFLKDGVELVGTGEPFAGNAHDQAAGFRAFYVVDFQQVPQQQLEVLL